LDRAKDRLLLVAKKRHHPRSVGGDLATLQSRASGTFGNAPLRRPSPVVHDAKVPGFPLGQHVHLVGPGLHPQIQQAHIDTHLANIGANRRRKVLVQIGITGPRAAAKRRAMNAVAGAVVVEAIDTPQEGQRACAVAFAGKQGAGIDDMGRRAVLADDPAELHPGEQIAPGGIQPDRNPAIDRIEGLGEPLRCAGGDPPVEIQERGIAEYTRFRTRHDRHGHGRLAFRGRLSEDRPTGQTDRREYQCKNARANGSRRGMRIDQRLLTSERPLFEYEPATSSQEEQAMIGTPTLRSIEGTFAAEALGIDLARPLDAEALAWIEQAFAAHPVLVFPEQDLGPRELAAFGRCFGRPKLHSLVDYRHAEYPEVSWLTNVTKDGNIAWFGVTRATDWHTDSPYEDEPPR